jgi:uncharacterized protein (DUF1778 family)
MKTERIEVRTEPEIKQLIQLAAALENSSDSDFIVKTLVAASEKVINTSNTTILTAKQFKRLEEYMESGYQPSEALIELSKRPRKYVVGDI